MAIIEYSFYNNSSEESLQDQLEKLRNKIEANEKEYAAQSSLSTPNQYILDSLETIINDFKEQYESLGGTYDIAQDNEL